MSTPKRDPQECLRCLRMYEQVGNNFTRGAKLADMNVMTFKRHVREALSLGLHLSDGAKHAMNAASLNGAEIKGGWKRVQHEDGSFDTVRWSAPEADEVEQPEDVLDRIADRLEKIRPAPAIRRPGSTSTSIRNFVPVSDVHLSMRVGDYGTAACVDRLKTGMADILDRMAPAECTILLNNGDFSEQNDPSNLTPQSKHPLPVDSEYDDTTDVATDVTAWMIESTLERSDHVIYKALKGNHDPHTARILRAALKQRYRDNPRVTIETDGIETFAHCWEGNFIAAHHGDLRKSFLEWVLAFAARYPEHWANSVFRELFLGHLHHKKVPIEKDETGMSVNQVRAIAPLGRHSIEQMYDSPSEMIGITYRKGGGRLTTITHGFWQQ